LEQNQAHDLQNANSEMKSTISWIKIKCMMSSKDKFKIKQSWNKTSDFIPTPILEYDPL